MPSTRSTTSIIESDSSDNDEFFDAVAEVQEEELGILDILYEVSWIYSGGQGKYESKTNPILVPKAHRLPWTRPRCVISIEMHATGVSTRNPFAPNPVLLPISVLQRNHPADDFQTTAIVTRAITIHSPHLIREIRNTVKYYPAVNLTGIPVVVLAPFAMFLHYYHDLTKLRDMYANNGTIDQTEEETIHDLTILIDWLEPQYINIVQKEEERHHRGVATFDNIWLLYKPGGVVYAQINGNWRAFIIDHWIHFPTFYRFLTWYLAYDQGRLVRKRKRFRLDYFNGERQITSLNMIPRQYMDNADERDAFLTSRGSRYHNVMRDIPRHLRYSGDAIVQTGFKRYYEGEIIIDPESSRSELTEPRKRSHHQEASTSDSDSDSASEGDSDNDSVISDGLERGIDDGLHISGQDSDKDLHNPITDWKRFQRSRTEDPELAELSARQKILLPTRLRGFALRHKLWMLFEVELTHTITRQDRDIALKNLIIPDEDRRILTAVTRKHLNSKASPLFSDFIHGKGEGLILLLHGPPGTGKTFTVECISEYTRRPLLSLTVGDIGTKEEQAEARLSFWFNLATRWEAVLLIDEADVFLEKRGLSDLARNSLVSVFLRSMEYYNGMLFLTTNRVGHLDDGFLSRIQVAITYKKLSTMAQKQIWLRFFDRINEENDDLSVTWEARHYIEEEGTVESMDMNGREIRNALQTAVALANDRAALKGKQSIEVSADDIKQIASRRQRFIEYIDGIRRASEQERALEKGDRNDQ
ncbi:P-loop containing nucleoside triphosphate hydrolase protein [Annulohypoxylon nitens]|nr:P-loop containing nucleoside triphosphate hydrolase protein [Annulohypoxylon nitens]